MREYMYFEKCYDGSLHRPGDTVKHEEDFFKPIKADGKMVKDPDGNPVLSAEARSLLRHAELILDDSKEVKGDPEAAVKAFVKKHAISEERQKDIFAEAKAIEPHEKLAALAAVIQE